MAFIRKTGLTEGSSYNTTNMTHFAEIDEKGIVKRVVVADQEFIDSGRVGNPKNWIQTSYNTRGGEHNLGGSPLRKNYAGIGYTYDRQRDAFIPPKQFDSWILDEQTCQWRAPKEEPQDGKSYIWSEEKQKWEEDLE